MSKHVSCPACGGDIPIQSVATAMAECVYCGNAVVVNEDVLRNIGKMAILADQESCLAVGYSARCLGRDITTFGRLQFRYDAGIWDEWWVQFLDSGSYAWISQDESVYSLELDISNEVKIPPLGTCTIGAHVVIAGETFVVEERSRATMVGVQGELPFAVIPNEEMRFVDLANETGKATISYFADGSVEVYKGQYLDVNELEPVFDEGGL